MTKTNARGEYFWLINNNGIPMWFPAKTKQELLDAGFQVLGGPRK